MSRVITCDAGLKEVETIQTKGAAQRRTKNMPMSQIGTSFSIKCVPGTVLRRLSPRSATRRLPHNGALHQRHRENGEEEQNRDRRSEAELQLHDRALIDVENDGGGRACGAAVRHHEDLAEDAH